MEKLRVTFRGVMAHEQLPCRRKRTTAELFELAAYVVSHGQQQFLEAACYGCSACLRQSLDGGRSLHSHRVLRFSAFPQGVKISLNFAASAVGQTLQFRADC